MNNVQDSKRLSDILSKARYAKGISQDEMALALGVSKNTISAYEKGQGRMTIKQFLDWFDALDENPTPYMLQFLNPKLDGIDSSSDDNTIDESLELVIKSLTSQQKRAVLYMLWGSHKSDPNAFLQLALAHLHNPLENRVTIARTVIDFYEMKEIQDKLVETNHIMPDIEILKAACESAKTAVMKGEESYSIYI